MLIAVALFGVGTIVFGLSRSSATHDDAEHVPCAHERERAEGERERCSSERPAGHPGRDAWPRVRRQFASNQLGEFESGVTAAWFGTVPAVVLGGVGTLVVVALWWRLFPQLAAVEELVPVETERTR
jgi:hypothetical protein